MTLPQITKLIEGYYRMKDGEFIRNHDSYFVVYEDEIQVKVKYKTLKHIVESRKRDKYTLKNIMNLFERMFDLPNNGNYDVLKSKGNNSYLLIENNTKSRAVVIALDIDIENDSLHIKTAFFRAVTKVK